MEILSLVIAALTGSGFTGIILAFLQRRWANQDKTDAIVNALKVLMVDRVRYVGNSYIKDQQITMSDKEHLKEMHGAYKKLGGNGRLDPVMSEVDKLPVVPD